MSKLIFFVDDDRMIINLLEYTFQSRQKYTVKSFSSGEDCLDNLNDHPDLIVLDHILSGPGQNGMDGLETFNEIRKRDENIPVIILTGQGDDELLASFLDAGVKKYLTKDDFFVDTLIESIDQILH